MCLLRPKVQVLAPLLLLLGSCGAEWHSVRDVDRSDIDRSPPPSEVTRLPEDLHGHRDFPATFERVWDSSIQALHAAGIGVPVESRRAEGEGRLDLDEVLLEVEQRAPGRVCVFARFRGVSRAEGEKLARALLDEIARRLRIQG